MNKICAPLNFSFEGLYKRRQGSNACHTNSTIYFGHLIMLPTKISPNVPSPSYKTVAWSNMASTVTLYESSVVVKLIRTFPSATLFFLEFFNKKHVIKDNINRRPNNANSRFSERILDLTPNIIMKMNNPYSIL